MSVRWTALIWDEAKDLEGSKLLLLLAIADHANDDGVCYPKVETLAKKARLSVRQTQRLLAQLEQAGYMIRDNAGGRGRPTNYILQPPEQWPKKDDAQMSPKRCKKGDTNTSPNSAQKGDIQRAERVTSGVKRVTSSAQKGDIASHAREEPSIEPSIEPSEEPELSADTDAAGTTPWQDFVGALCWVCYGHMKVNDLTEERKGQLLAEAKRIQTAGYTQDDLRLWFKTVWAKTYRWVKGNERPIPAHVRSSIPAIRAETPPGFEVGIGGDAGNRPRQSAGSDAVDAFFARLEQNGVTFDG